MAAVTPTAVARYNMGELTLITGDFANTTDDADTWATGTPPIIEAWAVQTDTAGTATSQGLGVSFSGSTITFHIGEDNAACTVFVLIRA